MWRAKEGTTHAKGHTGTNGQCAYRIEGIGHGASDQDHLTEHLVGLGGRAGGATLGAEAGERRHGGDPGDEASLSNTYLVWRALRRMGERGGD